MNKPKILIVYPNLPLMMAPSISVAIFTAICKEMECDVELFETTQYSDTYHNRHIRMTEIGVNRGNKKEAFDEMFFVKPQSAIIPDFVETCEKYKPDLLLVSVSEDVWYTARNMIAAVKHLDIPHVLGGVFPTSSPEIVLAEPHINTVAIQEGEPIVRQMLSCLKNGEDLRSDLVKRNIQGLQWKDRFGLIHKNSPAQLVSIADVTPDFTKFAAKRWQRPMGGRMFKRAVSMETYRGCPYNCTYCNSPNTRDISKQNGTGNYMRRKTADIIERDFLHYRDMYDPDIILFIDDSFLARPKKEIFDFCKMWSKYRIPFWFNTRIENCTPDILDALKEANAYRMTFGLESGNEQYRREVLSRNVSNEKYLEHFEYINESNIPYSLNVIVGMPLETREMVLETADLVRASEGHDGLTVSSFQPYHGTGLRDLAIKNGFLDPSYINSEEDLSGGLLGHWVLNMPEPYVQKNDVEGLVKCFSLYSYFERDRFDEIRAAETDDEIYQQLMKEYKSEFFADLQQGGKQKIEERAKRKAGHYCVKHEPSATYDFEVVSTPI